MNTIKIDWLNFTFKPTEEDISTFPTCLAAFFHYFPNVKNIMDECVVFSHSRRYYDYVLAWNDNILLSYDEEGSFQESTSNDSWGHGVNIQIPSHGLHNLPFLLGLDLENYNFEDFSEFTLIYNTLKDKHCQLSRLDIAFDDFNKRFTPADFVHFWYNGVDGTKGNLLQSPCRNFRSATSGIGGGCTFYLGGRSNKMLRVYDKYKESKGKIDSIRYEFELHNRYANECAEMIAKNQFDFFAYLQKYFIVVKQQKDGAPILKSKASMLDNAPEWDSFISENTGLTNNSQLIEFPKTPVAVTYERKRYWVHRYCAASTKMVIELEGIDSFFDMISNVVFTQLQAQGIEDAVRAYDIDYRQHNIEKLKQVIQFSKELVI